MRHENDKYETMVGRTSLKRRPFSFDRRFNPQCPQCVDQMQCEIFPSDTFRSSGKNPFRGTSNDIVLSIIEYLDIESAVRCSFLDTMFQRVVKTMSRNFVKSFKIPTTIFRHITNSFVDKIEAIDLSFNQEIRDDIFPVLSVCKSLQSLSLVGCKYVSGPALFTFAQSMKIMYGNFQTIQIRSSFGIASSFQVLALLSQSFSPGAVDFDQCQETFLVYEYPFEGLTLSCPNLGFQCKRCKKIQCDSCQRSFVCFRCQKTICDSCSTFIECLDCQQSFCDGCWGNHLLHSKRNSLSGAGKRLRI